MGLDAFFEKLIYAFRLETTDRRGTFVDVLADTANPDMIKEAIEDYNNVEKGSLEALWAETEITKLMDHLPPVDTPPSELPAYHYWGVDQNPVAKPSAMTPLLERYHRDMTAIPRFFYDGTPKPPLAAQKWYVPLTETGRFDWRANLSKNCAKPVALAGHFEKLAPTTFLRSFLPGGTFKREQLPLRTQANRMQYSSARFFLIAPIGLMIVAATFSPEPIKHLDTWRQSMHTNYQWHLINYLHTRGTYHC